MGLDTKDRILDVAERLFANRGFGATSLRDITNEAGVNLAAVNYHFGSKEELLAATMERRLRPINDLRIQMLDALEASGRHPTHHDVVRAFLIPFFEKHKEWGEKAHEFRLLSGRVHYEMHEDFRNDMLRPFDHVIERFVDAFLRTLPHLRRRDIRLRLLFLTGAMAYSLTWGIRLDVWGIDGLVDPEEMLDDLLVFSAAAIASSPGHALRTARPVGAMAPGAPAQPRANSG
ncbi:MAG: TetR/AcrR family transcriptional regulator [Vicinamibacterales bacterium]